MSPSVEGLAAASKKKPRRSDGLGRKLAIRKAQYDATHATAEDTKHNVKFRQRLREARTAVGLTQKQLGLMVGRGRSAGTQWESGRAIPAVGTISDIVKAINSVSSVEDTKTSAEWLAFGVKPATPVIVLPPDLVSAPEVVFGSAMTDRKTARSWGLPRDWLQYELGISGDVLIYKVEVDSAGYEYGDRVIVDIGTTKLQPAGTFLHWVGDGPVVSRISVIPSDNRKLVAKVEGTMGTVEVSVDGLKIIGRIRGLWRKA